MLLREYIIWKYIYIFGWQIFTCTPERTSRHTPSPGENLTYKLLIKRFIFYVGVEAYNIHTLSIVIRMNWRFLYRYY